MALTVPTPHISGSVDGVRALALCRNTDLVSNTANMRDAKLLGCQIPDPFIQHEHRSVLVHDTI